MRRVRQLAERTPANRERYLDLLRAVAIVAVVLGHWLITVIGPDRRGQLTGHSALPDLPWAHPITWIVQVLPVFFFVGGYANAASLTSRRRKGGTALDWLLDRSGRLLRPTTTLLLVLAAASVGARLLGAEPAQIRTAVWFATIPLWFLAAYLVVVALTPPMYALYRRYGFAVPVVLVVLVAAGDLARLRGPEALASGNFLFGWLAIHQVGFAWRDERPRLARPRVAVPLLLGGLVALVLLTVVGPYPTSMINIPGERLHNMSPPSLALLAAATFQLGLALLLRDPAERWLHRPRPWLVVVALNAVVLTIFLWHVSAVVLLAGGLHAVDLLPTPAVGTLAWWLWRIPWLLALMVVLTGLVAIFGPIEARSGRRPDTRPRWLPAGVCSGLRHPAPRALLTIVSFGATAYALLANSLAPKTGHDLFGLPTTTLVVYLAGAGVLRILRAIPDERR
ncbi:acyltransferase family protein [Micromonospora polyrhachis]|uniref:Acyltransferase 3 domain-containing protein n=1 Tax=Micromonospora polyrhachis TaxID=1282883 RepID=A0A7W7WSC5_9ACTN|nr:acyltransferase [Micromonospora polyrhachis]MBB4961849.1 hypothetical protein [Micromonospora polyrhachis]